VTDSDDRDGPPVTRIVPRFESSHVTLTAGRDSDAAGPGTGVTVTVMTGRDPVDGGHHGPGVPVTRADAAGSCCRRRRQHRG
jgi:hypothetical protein